jgi:hypothetical protein
MKTTLAVALATVVPGGLFILAGMFLWQMLMRRRRDSRAVPLLVGPGGYGRNSSWTAGKPSSAAIFDRTM